MSGNGMNGRGANGGTNGAGLDLAVIGNGRTAALVQPTGRLVWWCYPRFDGDPVFCRLVAGEEEKGFTDVVLDDVRVCESSYLRNTAVVSTVLTNSHASEGEIDNDFDVIGLALQSLRPSHQRHATRNQA